MTPADQRCPFCQFIGGTLADEPVPGLLFCPGCCMKYHVHPKGETRISLEVDHPFWGSFSVPSVEELTHEEASKLLPEKVAEER